MPPALTLTLVAGGSYAQREQVIATLCEADAASSASAAPSACIAVVLEGLPAGDLCLQSSSRLLLHRIAPGCFCCIGNLTMKVTLNRLLRQPLTHLYLAVASIEHLDNILQTLAQPPYQQRFAPPKLLRLDV
ncbi:GTPase [Undibacterium rugosum]|uniref:GTPase n=1 Tax=Undibacterium rugosum TaxID=2762291 RepID=A0A923HXK0_9BURK|nr:GTPase [Undibacterium rugosum]MBC3933826.1 GTPase [Undibacterium rugosum]MBR7777529.1 GTPase [Undibacterium rugosum]